jgi:hypothetical protein
MVSLYDTNVDVPFGKTLSGNFDVFIGQSSDTGVTFTPNQQLTNAAAGEAYPYMVRDGLKIHLLYYLFGTGGGPQYLFSGDGGATWAPPFPIGMGGQGFISYTGCALHVIWPDSGHIRYRTNPVLNCVSGGASINPIASGNESGLKLFPNPFTHSTIIKFTITENSKATLKIYDIEGREVATLMDGYQKARVENSIAFDASRLAPGTYFCRLVTANSFVTEKLILLKE